MCQIDHFSLSLVVCAARGGHRLMPNTELRLCWSLAAQVIVASLVFASPAFGASVIDGLSGKSVTAAWTETNKQEDIPSGRIREYHANTNVNIVINEQGHVIIRYNRSFRDRSFSTVQEFISDGSEISRVSSPYKFVRLIMSGNVLAANMIWGDHGAQLFRVIFRKNFTECSASFDQGIIRPESRCGKIPSTELWKSPFRGASTR